MQHFVHLRLHSEYSITDGVIRIKPLIEMASKDKMQALALTDLNNMFALVKFYSASMNAGIKPIIGSELSISIDNKPGYKIIALAKNREGYRKLCELITKSYTENRILDYPYIDEKWLLDHQWNDLIILSGGSLGDVGGLLLSNKYQEASDKLKRWIYSFGDNYYLELQRVANHNSDLLVEQSIKLAHQLNVAVVATHPVVFLKPQDYIAHEVRVSILASQILDDEKRHSGFTQDQYFFDQAKMCELFSDIPSAITNTVEIAKRCNLEIELNHYHLPNYQAPDGSSLDEYLSISAYKGLDQRLNELFPDLAQQNEQKPIYAKRLEIEIETILQMGFVGYFLIVADFINWAKNNNVPVGPGRGSGAGSLVAYALGITDLDPIRYNLLFERFLNSERVSMPDFDIDFCQDKRELVIEYVQEKYGKEAVSQIATFGTMSSKAVIKDVGRSLALPYGLCDSISKLIQNTPAKSYSLLEAYDKFSDLKLKIDQADDEVKRLWELSLQLEDIIRSVGKHAAGVLIAPGKLTDFCPLYVADGMQTSQLDKDDVEKIGLVKFDFLGLRNLTTIDATLENIKQLYGIEVSLSNNDFSDSKVYELLQKGNAASVFQLESQGMRRVLVKLEPDRFEDIIALLALYRPGPLGSGMVDDFIRRKKGLDQVDYFHPDLKECLEPTYGVIVYQEQVMQISQIIGGYTLGGADLLRRAMGKKKPEEMAKHKQIFLTGATEKGYKLAMAENLFDLMAKFAEYGFNKSHSAAYAVISYHTAYLKAHYLSAFMAATLSSELDKTDKLYEVYQDCLDNDLAILAPDINSSNYRFTPIDAKTISYALGAIKGIGKNIVDLIVNERDQNGTFLSFADFCMRVDRKVVNKKSLESLVKAGAFDRLDNNRAKLFNNIAKVMELVEFKELNANQGSLFDDLIADDGDNSHLYGGMIIELDEYPRWELKQYLHMEKQALGYYFSGSLFDEYNDIVHKLEITPLSKYDIETSEMQEFIQLKTRDKTKVLACGVVNYMGSRQLKNGRKLIFIRIEDQSGDIELVFYGEDYEKYKHLLKMDDLVFIEGELNYDEFRNQIKINAKIASTIDDVLKQEINKISLNLTNQIKLSDLGLNFSDNGAKLIINYENDQAKCKLELGKEYKLALDFDNLKLINQKLGKHNWGINGV